MLQDPYPDGQEEKFSLYQKNVLGDTYNYENDRNIHKVFNFLIAIGTGLWIALRVEIISASINFLDFRLNIKENELMKDLLPF